MTKSEKDRHIVRKIFFLFLVVNQLYSIGMGFLVSVPAVRPECDGCLSRLVNQSSCPKGTLYQEEMVARGCCPACVRFLSLNDECTPPSNVLIPRLVPVAISEDVFESQDCAPGLACQMNDDAEFRCLPDKGKCLSYQYIPDALWKPSCDPFGRYSPMQCKGDIHSGRCFCFDENGRRLFGQSWWIDAIDMSCACSREVDKLLKDGKRSDVSLHCTESGSYEELQCDDGICWCADSDSGLPLHTVVPEEMVAILPCYLNNKDDLYYLRQCESALVAAGRIKDILYKHGTVFSNMDTDRCDPDGSYGPFQISSNQVRCTWKDRSLIGGYACPVNQLKTVNCNCARDSIIFEDHEQELHMECGGNGNYNPLQISEDKSYCVDSDGYPTTGFIDVIECPATI